MPLNDYKCDTCGAEQIDVLVRLVTEVFDGPLLYGKVQQLVGRPTCCGQDMSLYPRGRAGSHDLLKTPIEIDGRVCTTVQAVRAAERETGCVARVLTQDRSNRDQNSFGKPPAPEIPRVNHRGLPIRARRGVDPHAH